VPGGMMRSWQRWNRYVFPALMLAGQAQAQDYEIACWNTDQQPVHALVANPQSVEIGQLLAPWTTVDAERHCHGSIAEPDDEGAMPPKIRTMRANALILRLPPAVAGIPAVMDDGQAHTVYTIPGLDGVGYILKARHYQDNTGASWSALNLVPGEEYTDIEFEWRYSYDPDVQTTPDELINASFQVALVKTGEVSGWPAPGWTSIDFQPIQHNANMEIAAAIPFLETVSRLPSVDTWETLSAHFDADGAENKSCTPRTPAMTHVVLAPASLSEFGGYGSVAKEKYFTLTWDCLPLNGANYVFHISSGQPSPDAAQGLIPQEHPSGAQGVAIQVFEDHNGSAPFIPSGHYTPIELGIPKSLAASADEYDAGQSTIKLPLKAQYYKIATDTGNDVMTAGSVEAGLRMVIEVY